MQPEDAEDVSFLSQREVEDRARAVLEEHGLMSIPVDPVVLANRLGIRVNNAEFSDDSMVGMIAKRGDNVTLLVNQGDPPFRKRFTIAHELGHHFLHLLQDGEFVDGDADLFRQQWDQSSSTSPRRRREIQANMFASSLLMPEEEVRREWPALRSIRGMARRFKVSEAAMGIRIDQLGLN